MGNDALSRPTVACGARQGEVQRVITMPSRSRVQLSYATPMFTVRGCVPAKATRQDKYAAITVPAEFSQNRNIFVSICGTIPKALDESRESVAHPAKRPNGLGPLRRFKIFIRSGLPPDTTDLFPLQRRLPPPMPGDSTFRPMTQTEAIRIHARNQSHCASADPDNCGFPESSDNGVRPTPSTMAREAPNTPPPRS